MEVVFIKGLESAVTDLLTNAERRMCARHIWANWQKKLRGEERRKAFWRCAKASFEPGRPSERVISSGSQAALKDAPQTNVDHGFKPSGLKWKEKNAMTGNHFQLMSQRNKLQIKSKRVP
ncbi:uncharacterized protein LOC129880035 isoform X2 [Solanum dulcamara]|uniref:uncharacterized protein LOC129880035 isoform X2 n=1 Tax=Solanum dulcamara TaxID=45834 RepID=UPI002484E3C9|nr:uncharacterized protein LOC129880035 isoform X2 [Solanum dulcamara]